VTNKREGLFRTVTLSVIDLKGTSDIRTRNGDLVIKQICREYRHSLGHKLEVMCWVLNSGVPGDNLMRS